MAGFLYFWSGGPASISVAKASEFGLGYAFAGASIETRQVNGNSPSGKAGLVFCDEKRQGGRVCGCDMANQTWRKMPDVEGRPELWVGYWNDAKPGPQDLQRETMLRGPLIKFADGNQWQIPIVRKWMEDRYESELPALLDYDSTGKITRGKPLAKYAELWDATTAIADAHVSGEAYTEDQLYDALFRLLAANYVVSFVELVSLGALADDGAIGVAVLASCRYDMLIDWIDSTQKKTESLAAESGETLSDGEAA